MQLVIAQGYQIPFVLPDGDMLTLRGGQIVPPELLRPGQAERLLRLGYAKQSGAPEPVQKIVHLDDQSVAFREGDSTFAGKIVEQEGKDRGERGGMLRTHLPSLDVDQGRRSDALLHAAREAQKAVREALNCGPMCFPRETIANLPLTEATELARSIDSAAPEFKNAHEAVSFLTRDLPKPPES